jgi:hypothetical protein
LSLREQLDERVESIFRSQWSHVDARVVPETKSIGLGNVGKKLDGTVLYADLAPVDVHLSSINVAASEMKAVKL